MSVIDKAEDVTVLAIVVGAGLLLYYVVKKAQAFGGDVSKWWQSSGGLSGVLAGVGVGAPSTDAIAAQTAAAVGKAGGTPAQQAAASAEVLQYAQLSRSLYWQGNQVNSGTIVPGTGIDIYTLRKDGYSDAEISSMLDDAAANPGAYASPGSPSLIDQGVNPYPDIGMVAP
jgi:hypothetical protein